MKNTNFKRQCYWMNILFLSFLVMIFLFPTTRAIPGAPSGTLDVSPAVAVVGQDIIIRIDAYDDTELTSLMAHYNDRWHSWSEENVTCYGKKNCTAIWTTSESSPGEYNYGGFVHGTYEYAYTDPPSVTVTVIEATTTTIPEIPQPPVPGETTTTMPETTTTTTISGTTTTILETDCGNDICDIPGGEKYETCPQDCPSGGEDGYCDAVSDGICDPDCSAEEDEDCRTDDGLILIVVIVIVLVALVIFFNWYLKEKRILSKLKKEKRKKWHQIYSKKR